MNEIRKQNVIIINRSGGGRESMEEREWVTAAKKGDEYALAQLFQQNYSFLVHYLIKLTYSLEQAEDLAQDTMAKAIEHVAKFNGKSKFSTWLISIATRLYIDQKRRQKREQSWQEQEQALRMIRWQAQSVNEDWHMMLESLGKLKDDFRIPILLKHYYGYSYEEIAAMLQIAEGTVKSRVHKGIQMVRKELNEDDKGQYPVGKTVEQN